MTVPTSVADVAVLTAAHDPFNPADPIDLTSGDGALYFENASDLVVNYIALDGTVTLLELGTHYEIDGEGRDGEGTITPTFDFAEAAGTLHVSRATPLLQEAAFEENDGFPAKTTEHVLDRDRLIDQDLNAQIQRSLRVPRHEDTVPILPAAADREGKYLRGKADGSFEFVAIAADAEELADIDSRLSAAEATIITINGTIITLDGRLDTVEATLVTLDGRLDTAEADIDAIEATAVFFENDDRIADVTDPTALQDVATKNYVDTQLASVNVGGAAQNSFRISGGEVTWISGFTFRVSAATYYIGGVLYSSPQTDIVLDAADADDDRIDVIAVNSAGAVVKVTGTAASEPSEPDVDPGTQLKLSIVFVPEDSIEPPDVVDELLYAENAGDPTEWDWTSSGAGWTLNSAVDPQSGAVTIDATNTGAGAYIQGEIGAGTIDPNAFDTLILNIKAKSNWNNNRGLQVTFRQGGVIRGVAVPINRTGSFGFVHTNHAIYQQIAIPIGLFAIPPGTLANQVRVQVFGGAINFRADNFSLQGAAVTQPQTGITQEQADARYAPLAPSYVVVGANSTLPNGRVLAAGANISLTDGGVGGPLTIAVTGLAAAYTNEDAQDAVGGILSDAGDIDFTYNDGAPSITAAVKASAITNAQLANAAAWSLKLRNAGTAGAVSDAAVADLTEEAAPAAGDFVVGFLAGGEIRKFDVGNLPGASSGISYFGKALTTPPTVASMTWVNQSTATAANNSTGALFMRKTTTGTRALSALVETAPATPYKMTVLMLPMLHDNTYQWAGICFRESATGKLITIASVFESIAGGAAGFVNVSKWTSATAQSGLATTSDKKTQCVSGPIWLEIEADGTNVKTRWGMDGENWDGVQFSEAKNAFFTTAPDQIGVFVIAEAATFDAGATFVSYEKH